MYPRPFPSRSLLLMLCVMGCCHHIVARVPDSCTKANVSLPGIEKNEKLEKFIDRKIRPDTENLKSLSKSVKEIVSYLHRFNHFVPGEDYRLKKIVKSGSLGKGTAVRGKADIDLILFLQRYASMQRFLRDLPTILRHLRDYLALNPKLALDDNDLNNAYMVKCFLTHHNEKIKVDILPTIDMIDIEGSLPALYKKMALESGNSWEGPLSHYSVCLAEKQRDFVKGYADKNSKIKDLIRLVKYWSKVHCLATVSYCLELVCIATWREYDSDGGTRRFDMRQLFWKVLDKLENLEKLEIKFDQFFDSSTYKLDPPSVMDPANPFSNTLPREKEKRKLVMETARETLKEFNQSNAQHDEL